MKPIVNTTLLLLGAMFLSESYSQAKQNQLPIQSEKKAQMENQKTESKEFILLVRVPITYGADQAKEVREKWNALLEKWKSNGTYITSFVYPSEGYLVTGPQKVVTNEGVIAGNFKLVSNMILKAADYETAIELAKNCPVLAQGGMIEVREIQPRPNPNN